MHLKPFLCACGLLAAPTCAFSSMNDSPLTADPDATWGQFSNGMRTVLYRNQTPPGIVTMRLYVGSGSLQETDQQRGLAHFLEHMAFNGTAHFPAGQMVEYFQRMGMAFGADTNAYTSFDQTVYKLNLPDDSDKTVHDSLTLLRDYVDAMTLDAGEIERERGVILSEKRTRDTVDYRQIEDFYAFTFAGSKLAERLPIGVESVIEKAPRELFADFYARWYTPERVVLVVTGDFDIEKMREKIGAIFEQPFKDKIKNSPDGDFGKLNLSEQERVRFFPEPQAQAASITLTWMRPYGGHLAKEDTFTGRVELLKLDAAMQILQTRVKERLQSDDTPFAEGGAYRMDLPAMQGEALCVSLEAKPENWQRALQWADMQLRGALKFGFTQDEVQQVRAELDNYYRRAAEKASTRTSDALANSLVDAIARERVWTHPRENYELFKPVIENLAAEQLQTALEQFYTGAGKTIHVSGPMAMNEQQGELEINNALKQEREKPLEPPTARALNAFGYSDWGAAGEILETKTHAQTAVVQTRFANEVRLNVKRTDFEANNILIHIRVGQGKFSLPEGKEALGMLAQAAFLRGGLQKHPFGELERLMALNKLRNTLSLRCADDAFVLEAQASPESLKFALECLAAYVSDAGYREDVLGQARQLIEQEYRRARYTMEGALSDQLARFLADGSTLFGLPEQAQFSRLTMADLKDWMAAQLAQGYLEISIVGDIDEQAVSRAVAATFGALPKRAAAPATPARVGEVKIPAAQSKSLYYHGQEPRAASLFIWPSCDAWDIERVRALNVLSEVFSDRLRLRLRQALGETYSPFAFNRSSEAVPGRGFFQSFSVVKPESVDKVGAEVEKIAAELFKDGVSDPDEFQRAKAPFKMRVQTQLRQNAYWLRSVLARSWEHPELLTRPLTIEQDYMDMPVEKINAAAKDFLAPEKAIRAQVLPDGKKDE